MTTRRLIAALVGAAILSLPTVAAAQKAPDLGKREYDANCAVCHGKTGKGDGTFAWLPSGRAADLTTLSKRNGGVFPFQAVYEYIDGTKEVKGHGPRDMPIWGDDYVQKAREAYRDENYMMSPYDPQLYTRTRILALTEYLYRIQAK